MVKNKHLKCFNSMDKMEHNSVDIKFDGYSRSSLMISCCLKITFNTDNVFLSGKCVNGCKRWLVLMYLEDMGNKDTNMHIFTFFNNLKINEKLFLKQKKTC